MDDQIFVKLDEYNEILKIVKLVKEKISKAQKTIENITELKAEEETELKNWNDNLEAVTANVAEIEKSLSQVH